MLLSFGKEKLLWYHSLLELVRSNLVSVGACTLTWWNLIKHESSSGGTCWAPFLLLLFLMSVDKYLFLFWYDEENTEFLLLHLSQKVVRGQPCTTWRLLVPKIRRSGCSAPFRFSASYAISNGVSFKLTLLVYVCRKQTPHSLLPLRKGHLLLSCSTKRLWFMLLAMYVCFCHCCEQWWLFCDYPLGISLIIVRIVGRSWSLFQQHLSNGLFSCSLDVFPQLKCNY